MEGSPIVPPGGQFPIPATSESPLLALRCAQTVRPYLAEDAFDPAGVLIDSPITYSEIVGAETIALPEDGDLGELLVTVTANGRFLTEGIVPLNASKVELPFSLLDLEPQMASYELEFTGTYVSISAPPQTFQGTGALSYLPDPPDGGSATKMDLRTGGMLAKPATGKGGAYKYIIPVGFYTIFDGYLTNLTNLQTIKELGYVCSGVSMPWKLIKCRLGTIWYVSSNCKASSANQA